ncbi:MAG: hypothetical protein ACLFSG_04255 [Halothiobacillaceae bacterium]
MVEIREGALLCRFADGWKATKYDETPWHQGRLKSQLRAIDVLATDGAQHWWIEIKDCEGFEQDNRPRMSPTEADEVVETRNWIDQQGWKRKVGARRKKPWIVDEVVEKVRHTLVAIALAEREGEPSLQHHWLVCGSPPLSVALLLTWGERDYKRLAQRLQDKLNGALAPYNVTGYVFRSVPPSVGLQMTVERT